MAKNRRKKFSIANFILVAILTLLGVVLSVCSFDIPFTTYTYNGFAKSISLGLDLAGGVSVVYECSLPDDANENLDLENAISATEARLTSLITDKYSEATITRQGNTRIRIEVPSVSDAEEVFNLIGTPTPLYMTLEQKADAEVYIKGSDISQIYASLGQKDEKGVTVVFNSEGESKFYEMTKKASEGKQEIYIYFSQVDADADLTLKCEEPISGGRTFISGSFKTIKDAQDYALRLMSGTFSAKLELLESSVISATLGAQALKLAIIGGLVGLVLIMILLMVRYGDFGALASFALVIYIVLMLFFLQAISFVQLTLPGLAGIILSIGMADDGTVIIFERFREEYRSGKKIPLASKIGFKRAFWPIFDSNITTIITAIVLYILGTASIQGFAITLLIGIVLSMFMNLVVLRTFVNWYLPINSIKPNKLRLPKQARAYKDPSEVVVEGGATNE